MQTQKLTANQKSTILELQDYLTRIAHNIVRTHFRSQDPDELLSVMNDAIVAKAASDPTFLEQSPGYITRKAAWAARDYCKREVFGQNLMPVSVDTETDGARPLAETLAAPLADLDLSIDLQRALAQLSPKRQQIAAMLVSGFQRREIAETFGVKSPSLTWDLAKIKEALAPVYAQMVV